MPVIWKWASGKGDLVVVSETREEVARAMKERGYAIIPAYGMALELTDEQFAELKRLVCK